MIHFDSKLLYMTRKKLFHIFYPIVIIFIKRSTRCDDYKKMSFINIEKSITIVI